MTRILLIGPLPPPVGGTTRHFQTLAQDLEAHDDFSLRVIDTSRGDEHAAPSRNLFVGMRTLLATLLHLWHADVVSYHASNRGMLAFGPLIVGLCKLARRPVALRIFGGGFGDYYLSLGALKRVLIRRFIFSADAVLLQTRRAVSQLEPHAKAELVWFSTYIKPAGKRRAGGAAAVRAGCTRFVFLGHLWRTKGIEQMLHSAPHLPAGCTIDVFGPQDAYGADEIETRGRGRVRYRGLLSHDEVDARLWDYDCLVLPTFHANEGYPGVIAEAFEHGLPVITTRWLAIPEIVDASCGILIPPRDTRAFIDAVHRIHGDPELWQRLSAGARARAALFDHVRWAKVFEEVCERLVRDKTRLRE
jgi:glycosyltransferase involved in cell wall biosynthesis